MLTTRCLLALCLIVTSVAATEIEGFPFPFPLDAAASGSLVQHVAQAPDLPTNTYFFRSYNATSNPKTVSLDGAELPEYLDGLTHFRLLPGSFPDGFDYHFDGLATVLKFEIKDHSITWTSAPYQSKAYELYPKCLFIGSGTGPTLGTKTCLRNPGVNLLPIDGQLWLTIDTALWGRMDPATLETVDAKPQIKSTVLNAHPACDRSKNVCYVQHPCDPHEIPLSKDVCFSVLKTTETDLNVEEVGRAQLPKDKLIQHSHSPCITPNYVVSKIDAFTPRNPFNKNKGLLKYVHQSEDSLWLVMDRRTNHTEVMPGNAAFVNNHAWNCYEDTRGEIVVEVVAATEDYLDVYFQRNLAQDSTGSPAWDQIFHQPLRCKISPVAKNVTCNLLLKETWVPFDYPTFNPLFKMNRAYRYFYAIAPRTNQSAWFDKLIKVDVTTGKIAQSWAADGIFLTEFDFIPNPMSGADEDSGALVSILYNSTSDESMLGIFDAKTLSVLSLVVMDQVVPFHAHGIVCPSTGNGKSTCFTNP